MNPMVRVLGVAAMAGGALRIADSFVIHAYSLAMLAMLYFLTDVFLLAGMAGIYWSRRAKIGIAGTLGAAIFVVGILLVRVAAFGVFGTNGYQLGAATALIGLAILSAETLTRRDGAYVSAGLWLLSLALGIAGALGVMPAALQLLAGVAFGAGFVAAGLEVFAT